MSRGRPLGAARSGRSCVRFVPLPYSFAAQTRFAYHSVLEEERSIAWPYIAPRKPVQKCLHGKPMRMRHSRPALPARNRPRLIRAAAPECDTGGRRSRFARLVLRGRFGSAVVGAARGPFLPPLQLLVVFDLFDAVALGTLKAIIRFAHQQTPGDLQRVKTRPSPAILCGSRTPLFSMRGLPQLSANPLDQ